MKTGELNNDGIKGLSIEIEGRGADFYADGSFYAWPAGIGMFNHCEASGNLVAHISRASVLAAIDAAEKVLGVEFSVGAVVEGGAS